MIIPALNEATRIARVLAKLPADGRFEAIVVDDGSDDGTGDEARAHGAALVIRHDRPQGVGAGIRDGFFAARQRGATHLAVVSGDDQHEPGELLGALEFLLDRELDYVQGSRWLPGGRVIGAPGGRGPGTRLYSILFSILVGRRVTDATNGFRILRVELLADPRIDLAQSWLESYELEPYLLYRAITSGYRVAEFPVTVRYHRTESNTKMRGIRDWWRLARPALLLRSGARR